MIQPWVASIPACAFLRRWASPLYPQVRRGLVFTNGNLSVVCSATLAHEGVPRPSGVLRTIIVPLHWFTLPKHMCKT